MSKFLAVYCGSSIGNDPRYGAAARELGLALVQQGYGLVYGGGKVGLMGIIADAVLEAEGQVIGVIPKALEQREIAHKGLSQLLVVANMHERKAKMIELAQGFIAMPGGVGTLEEIIEAFTWLQLGYHQKPCGLLNVAGYFDTLLAFLDQSVEAGFQKKLHRQSLLVAPTPQNLLGQFGQYTPPPQKWT